MGLQGSVKGKLESRCSPLRPKVYGEAIDLTRIEVIYREIQRESWSLHVAILSEEMSYISMPGTGSSMSHQ
jgi:hypothetical protein